LLKTQYLFFWSITYLLFTIYPNSQIRDLEGSSYEDINSEIGLRSIEDPALTGPEILCVVFGSVIGDFFGAGDPETDVYAWVIRGPDGEILFDGSGGAGFQTLSYTFSDIGTHQISLEIFRGAISIFLDNLEVEVINGAEVLLRQSYTTCSGQDLTLSAINPSSDNFEDYIFEWRDDSNTIISVENDLINPEPGSYTVTFFQEDSQGNISCERTLETRVDLADTVEIIAEASTTCPGEPVVFRTDQDLLGDWYYQKEGSPEEILISTSRELDLEPSFFLDGPGEYEIIFRIDNPETPECSLVDRVNLTYNPRPEFTVIAGQASSGCQLPDGTVIIEALTELDEVTIDGTGQFSGPLSPGDTFKFTGLKSGTYTGLGTLGNCVFRLATVVALDDPPSEIDFEVSEIMPEMCTETGKVDGSFIIDLLNGPAEGGYRVLNERGSVVRNGSFDNRESYPIDLFGGTYFVEVFDLDECSLPASQEVVIEGLNLVQFFIQSEISVCQTFDYVPSTAQDLLFTLTRPDGSTEQQFAGEAFTLDQEGQYLLLGEIENQNEICPRLETFNVTLVNPIEFEPVLVEEDCFGNRIYQAILQDTDPSNAVFTWFDEEDNVVSREEFLIPTTTGTFKLDVQPRGSQSCPIPPKEFEITEPVLSVDLTLEKTQLCELGPGATISLSTTFPDEVTDIEWRRYDANRNIQLLPEFKDQTEIIIEEPGVYEAAVFSRNPSTNKDCELGRETVEVEINPNKIDFEIPSELTICERFLFSPETSQPLTFEVTSPDGDVVIIGAGEEILLDQSGIWEFYGFDDNSTTLCPELKELTVQLNEAPIFEAVFQNKDCEGNQTYIARVQNYNSDEVSYSWKDSSGNVMSTDQVLTTSDFGEFSLEIQPLEGESCEDSQIFFEVQELVLEVSVNLEAAPFCPESPSTLLTATGDFTGIGDTRWFFTDFDGVEVELVENEGQREIEVSEEGTYEVRVVNDINCILGTDMNLVLRISDSIRPELEDSYQVCPRYEIGPNLDPGDFAGYQWYLEDQLLSTSPVFKPTLPGNYTLLVESNEGCFYSETFVTEEECELRVSYPNAVEPANPDKLFLVYTNYLIDELEVSIYNQWGELIFYCNQTELLSEEATCFWDGTYQGKKIPNGSYAIRLNFKNFEQNIDEYQLGTILVIE